MEIEQKLEHADNLPVEDRRADIVEVDGDRYFVSYEQNSIDGTLDARAVSGDDPDRSFLYNERENDSVGDVYVIDEGVAERPGDAIDYLEEEIDGQDAEDAFDMDGLDSL